MTPERKAWIVLLGITTTEAFPLVIYTMQGPLRFAKILGFYGPNKGTPLGWALAFVVAAVFVVLSVRRSPFMQQHFTAVSASKLFAVLIFAPVTGIFEELYFRKLLMDSVLHHGGSAAAQVLASALLFGLAHGVWGLLGRSLRIAIGATVATGLLGSALAVVYLASARSVAPCIASHALINACIEPWLILSAASRQWGGLRGTQAEPLVSRSL
jgi:uncharacterized protein